jgi:hypothetical protein
MAQSEPAEIENEYCDRIVKTTGHSLLGEFPSPHGSQRQGAVYAKDANYLLENP